MRERRYRALCALALALPLCALLRESLFGGKVLCQADHLLSFPPWSEVAPPGHVPGNPVLEDQSILTVPWLGFAAERIRAGELPLWNPHNYGGQPIHAVGSGAFLWPVHFLYYLFPTLGFYAWSALLRLLAAGFFMLLFLRRIGVSRTAALPGAGAFMLSGFLIAWLNHPHSNVALLVPAVLWAVERVAARPRWREAGVFGLVYGLQLLGGHLQTSLHLTLVLAAWCLFRTRVVIGGARLGGAGWGRLLTGGVLGLLLAAPQILPFLEYVGHESQGAIVLETEEQTAELDLLDAAAVMVAPGIHGGPHTNDYTGPEGRNINFNEIIGGYVGRLMLVLALVGAARSIGRGRDSRALFLACLALVAALVAWQVWPLHDIVRAIPGLRSTNTTRLLLFVAFGLAALGAIGVDVLRERLRLEGRKAAVLGLACFAVTAGELVAFGDGYNPAIEPHLAYPRTPVTDFLAGEEGLYRVEGVHRTTLRASANLPYGISKLSGYDKVEFRPMTQLALLLTTGAVEGPFHSEIDVIDRMEALPLASLLGIRFLISEEELPPPLELAYTSPGGLFVYSNPGALPRAFVARGFVVLEDQDERLAHLGAADMDPSIAVLHRRPEGEVDVDATGFAGTVEVERYAPLEVVLRAEMERPGLVVLADAFHPGWTATVDGGEVEIERVDHALRGIWLGAGESRIEMRYEPASMRVGLALGAFALLAIGALIGLGRRSR